MVKPFSLLDEETPQKRRKKSKKQELSLADMVGGKVQPASGAKWYRKGDVRQEGFLYENKTTSHGSFSISLSLWEEIKKKAMMTEAKTPGLQLDLANGTVRLMVIDLNDWVEIIKRLEYLEEKMKE
jgi:hypothetical protein